MLIRVRDLEEVKVGYECAQQLRMTWAGNTWKQSLRVNS